MIQKGILLITSFLLCFTLSKAQLNLDKVKNIFGTKEAPSILDQHIQQLRNYGNTPIYSGSTSEVKITNYMSKQFRALLYKPYLGNYVHRFGINKKNNLSTDSYIKIFNQKLEVGDDIIVPPFSGTGKFYAQALPGMPEADNLWFIKFTDVGVELNNKHGNGLEKMYRKAAKAIEQGAEAVMFLNNDGASSDFTNSFNEKRKALTKPVFILNHAAYKKYLVQQAKGKEWVHVDYDFSKTSRRSEGHNVIGYWQNQSAQNIVITARIDDLQGKRSNIAGLAALLGVAETINKARLKKYNYILVGLSGTNDNWKGAESFVKKLRLTKENTSAVIHIDDIGLIDRKNQLFVSGTGTSPDWQKVKSTFTKNFLLRELVSGEIGEENHRYFYDMGIPVLNIFTKGKLNNTRINKAGVAMVVNSVGEIVTQMDNMPTFTFTKTKELPDTKKLNFTVSMGITPDYAFSGKGLLIGQVKESSPAAMSSVAPGDVLVRMGDYDIRDVNDYVRELAKYKKGSRLMIRVKRQSAEKQMLITFK